MILPWSLDARVMVRPATAFPAGTDPSVHVSAWTACRRPLFVAFVLGCLLSLITSGTLTVRLTASAMAYWGLVPAIEAAALAMVAWRHRRRVPTAAAIDLFFAGHAPWTLLLIAICASLTFLPPWAGWTLLLRLWAWVMLAVIGWSAWLDFWYFRRVLGESGAAAVRDVLLIRAVTWTLVVALFAWPSMNAYGVSEVVTELLR